MRPGATVTVGGFGLGGKPLTLVEALGRSDDTREPTKPARGFATGTATMHDTSLGWRMATKSWCR